MEKTFRFKVRVYNDSEGNHYLRVSPFFVRNNKGVKEIYPIDFSELNVPLFIKKEDYFLDFENSFDGIGNLYRENYFRRDKQKIILNELEKKVDPLILKFLQGDTTLLKKDNLINQ